MSQLIETIAQHLSFLIAEKALVLHGDPYPPFFISIDHGHEIMDDHACLGDIVKRRKRIEQRIIDIHASIGTDPDVPLGIFIKGRDEISSQSRILTVIDAERMTVIAVQAVFRANPHKAGPILEYPIDGVLREAVPDINRPETIFKLLGMNIQKISQ